MAYLNQGNNYSVSFVNSISGNNTNMSYTCNFDTTPNGGSTATTACTSLPGTASFNTSTGAFSWTPNSSAWGPYEIKVVGTDSLSSSTGTTVFVIDVNPAVVLTNLRGNWDAQFANLTAPYAVANPTCTTSPPTPLTERSTAPLMPHGSEAERPRIPSLSHSTEAATWISIERDVRTTSMMFTAWVKPTSVSTGDTVIFGDSGDNTGNGFTLRQSKSLPGRVELSIGQTHQELVLAYSPAEYWRLGDRPELHRPGYFRKRKQRIYEGTTTLGQTGGLTGDSSTSVLLDGSTGLYRNDTNMNAPNAFSIEVWFKSANGYGNGGKLVGFSNSQTGTSEYDYDRHIWMGNSGTISFGCYNYSLSTITSSGSYNNGAWHQAIGTYDGSNSTLCRWSEPRLALEHYGPTGLYRMVEDRNRRHRGMKPLCEFRLFRRQYSRSRDLRIRAQ